MKIIWHKCVQRTIGLRVSQLVYQKQNKMIQKKFMSNSSQTSLEHKPRGLRAENNIVCNTVRQKYICCLLRYKMLKVQQRVSVNDQYYHIGQIILALANIYCIFHIVFMYHGLSTVLSHLTFHVSLSSLPIKLKSKHYESNISAFFY